MSASPATSTSSRAVSSEEPPTTPGCRGSSRRSTRAYRNANRLRRNLPRAVAGQPCFRVDGIARKSRAPHSPGPRQAAGGAVRELSCDGQSDPAKQVVRIPQRIAVRAQSTRIPLPSHAAAAACRRDTVPPAIRRAGQVRRPVPGHDNGSLRRLARDLPPRPVALCTPDNRSGPRGVRAPQRNGRRGVAPVRARPRRGARCPCGASTALPRDCGEARPAPSGAPTNARRFVRRRHPEAASDCGRLYHAVITPALLACLADPLPPLAWRPLLPPVTTPSPLPATFPARPFSGVVTGGFALTSHVHWLRATDIPRCGLGDRTLIQGPGIPSCRDAQPSLAKGAR